MDDKVGALEERVNELGKQVYNRLKEADRELNGVLTRAQKEVICGFSPCIIPPRDLKDPVRVGQTSGDLDEILFEMDHLRCFPQAAFEAIVGPLVDARRPDWAPLGDRAKEKGRLEEILRRAYRLARQEYGLQREGLAKELTKGRSELEKTEQMLSSHYEEVGGGLTKAGQYLLNPRVARLLEERVNVPQPASVTDATAESCDKSDCGQPAGPTEESTHCRCGAPRFPYVMRLLDLSPIQVQPVERAVAKARRAAYELLARPRKDGRNVLFEMYEGKTPWEEVFSLEAPEGNATYCKFLERMGELRDREMAEILTSSQRETWENECLGPLDVELDNGAGNQN